MHSRFIVATIAVGALVSGFALTRLDTTPEAGPAKPPTTPPVVLAGLTWHSSLDDALQIARKENKPVLHLQMFGRLNDEFC